MTRAEQDIEDLTSHALSNSYVGPPINGDMYCGWPLAELLRRLPSTSRQAEAHFEILRRTGMAGGMLGSAIGLPIAPAVPFPNNLNRPHSLEEMMAMRMRWGTLGGPWAGGFIHMAMHSVGDHVHIWIITKDKKSVVLEDEMALYPSDGLITKIRLMQQE